MNKVKELRIKRGYTVTNFAKAANISRQHLRHIENQELDVGISKALRIAKALNEKVENIFLA